MCGICGYIRFDNGAAGHDTRIINRMNEVLKHRGPDAQDQVIFDNVALGFSRLSIIGLENGMQPISNEDGSVIVICNGEIFNYVELRNELKQRGHSFRTASDVEVLVHLYEEHGTGLLELLNGQFAFALYDKKKQQLFCARDHLGIIPFFYTFAGNNFIFGSEIKALLQHPAVVKEVDLTGLDQIFTFAGLISPRTMFRNISSLENGHYLLVSENGKISKTEYWDLIYPEGETPEGLHPEEWYTAGLEKLFDQSIQLRLRADVPSGVYLSGGLDSSMIAMKVAQYQQQQKTAFSIEFAEAGLSETVYQKMVAAAGNYELHQQLFFHEDISRRLFQSVYHSECPVKETYNTASFALSDAVRKKGIRVVLSGEGADEFFAGYVGYRFDKMRAMQLVPGHMPDTQEAALRKQVWGDEGFFYEDHFGDITALKKSLYSNEVNAIFDDINCLHHPVVRRDRLEGRSVLHKRSYIDYKLRLVDHLVGDHGDRMALANSIEVRYPFLDRHLVEYAATIPENLKLQDFTEKYILKKMAAGFVPRPVIEREKFGFVAPGSPYLIQQKIPYVEELLSHSYISRQGIFNPDMVEDLRKKYATPGFAINAPFESDLLITVLTFGIWHETFFK